MGKNFKMVNTKFLDVRRLVIMDIYNANLVIDYFQMVVLIQVLFKDAMYMHQIISVILAKKPFYNK